MHISNIYCIIEYYNMAHVYIDFIWISSAKNDGRHTIISGIWLREYVGMWFSIPISHQDCGRGIYLININFNILYLARRHPLKDVYVLSVESVEKCDNVSHISTHMENHVSFVHIHLGWFLKWVSPKQCFFNTMSWSKFDDWGVYTPNSRKPPYCFMVGILYIQDYPLL